MNTSQSRILTLNGGSSSIRFALYQIDGLLKRCLYGKVDRIGLPGTVLQVNDLIQNREDSLSLKASDHRSAANALIGWLEEQNNLAQIKAVGLRVVHGLKHTALSVLPRNCLMNCSGSVPKIRSSCLVRLK